MQVVCVQGWDDMPPAFQYEMRNAHDARRVDTQARLLAARRLYSLMSTDQVAAILNEPIAAVSGSYAAGAKQASLPSDRAFVFPW